MLLLQSNEELQSAIERARAFERRDDYERRVGAYDRSLNMLANMVRMAPVDIDEEVRIAGRQDQLVPSPDCPEPSTTE